MATSNFYSKFWLQAIDMILYSLLISAIIVAPSSVISSPVKLDPQSHTLPDVNVPTSGQYDKSDTYRTDGNPWIVHLLPEQPTYLRRITKNFANVLLKAFPASAGWSFISSVNELSNDSLLVHSYDAQYGVDITKDPHTGKWSRTSCLFCQGTEFNIEYRPKDTDPLLDVHWIQVVTSGTKNAIDGGGTAPYYDLTGIADNRRLFDFPIRGGKTQQKWHAELFLVTGPKPSDGPGVLIFYGGLHWGWENHKQAP